MDMMGAVIADDVEAAMSLIDGEAIDSRDSGGRTPLMVAIANENARMVELLLRAKPDIDIPDRHGTTALLLAAVKGNMEIVDILLKYMAASRAGQ